MKKALFLFAFVVCLFSNKSYSQTKTLRGSFSIENIEDKSKIDFYSKLIELYNFESYRLRKSNTILEFKNGFSLVLVAADNVNEIIKKEDYPISFSQQMEMPVFGLDNHGGLYVELKPVIKEKSIIAK